MSLTVSTSHAQSPVRAARTPSPIPATLAHPALWVGLVGSLIVAAGELRRVADDDSGAVWAANLSRWVRWDYPLGIAIGIAVLSLGWLMARPRPGHGQVNVAVLVAAWAAPLLLLPPMLSTDAGSYADLGWMVMNGDSPYVTGLGETGSPFAYGRAWQGATSIYPALALQLLGWIVAATGAHPYWSVVALRILVVAGAVMLLWAIPKLARRIGVDSRFATWIAVANPLTLIHGIGGEHLDLLMVGLVAVAAVLAARRWGTIWAGVVLGLAIGIKQPALLAIPAVAILTIAEGRRTWLRVLGAGAAVGLIALLTFTVTSELTGLGLGWIDATGTPSSGRATLTPAWLVSTLTASDLATLTEWGQMIALAVIVILFLTTARREPLRFLALAALAWALGFGVLREWYLIFPLAFLGLARPGRPMRVFLWLVVPFFALYGTWKEYQRADIAEAALPALGWAAVAVWLGWVWWALTRPQKQPAPA